MSDAPFTISRFDVRFEDSLDAGEPGCLCSRCLTLIEEHETPIRAWPESGAYEYRFHPRCLGFLMPDQVADDEPDEERP